ncbi:MAG: response regulator [Candidatus Omnitrophica bacterium]|nr:response regulator [Candidatus Omnitrophota bacterium]
MGKNILIVDDDKGICDSLSVLLREEGYSVDGITDGLLAKARIREGNYDLCIFDYKMKGVTGIELLKMAKEADPGCPVFIISGVLDIDGICGKWKKAGIIDGVISKPFDVEALLKRIAGVIK